MGHKKRRRHNINTSLQTQYRQAPVNRKRARFSTSIKVLSTIFAAIIISGLAYWQLVPKSTQSVQASYPQEAAGAFYSTPTIATNGTKGYLSFNFVNQNKLVFLDLKLLERTDDLSYQDRSIPLSQYRGGLYLPLVVVSTPLGRIISGIRVCEPCGSFSFHIVEGRFLDCDKCHTKWTIENLVGASGGCTGYPPPRLTSLVNGDNIEIDLSPLQVSVTS